MTAPAKAAGAVDIVYESGGGLYVNLTSRCTNRCRFCVGQYGPDLWGYRLRFPASDDEPSPAEVAAAIRGRDFDELVFCGFGEPFVRGRAMVEALQSLSLPRERVRVNTNGQAFLLHPRSILDELRPYVGTYSLSLNAPDAVSYDALCRPEAGLKAFPAILDFIEAARHLSRLRCTAVRETGVDLEATADLARRLGVSFRLRG